MLGFGNRRIKAFWSHLHAVCRTVHPFPGIPPISLLLSPPPPLPPPPPPPTSCFSHCLQTDLSNMWPSLPQCKSLVCAPLPTPGEKFSCFTWSAMALTDLHLPTCASCHLSHPVFRDSPQTWQCPLLLLPLYPVHASLVCFSYMVPVWKTISSSRL